ncbi:Multi antimicrobial extrusion protein [Trema orientale]|uniref:Multi antimicrobial extrusion protein n=1 Tax=Trema orientale TaxID=63057 RepID=A0A2P5FG32_TREOI|nr:Multi antimicrobial extrusion protein [Trema orientale]
MGSALETFCGQAYGAKQYNMLGVHMQRAMLVLTLMGIPIALLWSFTEHIFRGLKQDPKIATGAGLFDFGSKGAALSIAISYWINVLILAVYIKFSAACRKTWTGFSKEGMKNLLDFLKLGVPSALMVCLEDWSYEFLILMSGLLPNPKLETSMMSIRAFYIVGLPSAAILTFVVHLGGKAKKAMDGVYGSSTPANIPS